MVNVFGQVPEFQKSQSTDFLRATKMLATLSYRKFFYLHYIVIELIIESESTSIHNANIKHYSSTIIDIGFVEFCGLRLNSSLMVKLSNNIYGTNAKWH